MRRDTGNADFGRILPEHLPDYLLAEAKLYEPPADDQTAVRYRHPSLTSE
jgi:hypothetical protein